MLMGAELGSLSGGSLGCLGDELGATGLGGAYLGIQADDFLAERMCANELSERTRSVGYSLRCLD